MLVPRILTPVLCFGVGMGIFTIPLCPELTISVPRPSGNRAAGVAVLYR